MNVSWPIWKFIHSMLSVTTDWLPGCLADWLTDYCQHLLLAFPKLPIFGATDGHTAVAAATTAVATAAAATTTCRTYHSKTNFYIIAFVAGSENLGAANPDRPSDNARHYFYINCMPLARPVAFHPANCKNPKPTAKSRGWGWARSSLRLFFYLLLARLKL